MARLFPASGGGWLPVPLCAAPSLQPLPRLLVLCLLLCLDLHMTSRGAHCHWIERPPSSGMTSI